MDRSGLVTLEKLELEINHLLKRINALLEMINNMSGESFHPFFLFGGG